jgi:hypothetical protein
LTEVEAQERSDSALSNRLAGLLLDAYRPGKPATLSPDGSSLGILFAYYEFIYLISYGYDTAAIRFRSFYMPTIS